MRKSLAWCATLVLLPCALAAQSPEARIEAARARTEQAGLPITILDERIAEGRAKGVAPERIAEAIERRAAALVAARDALGQGPPQRRMPTAELSAAADAIEAGIPVAALRQVLADARPEDRPVALAVLTFLRREAGMPLENALARVAEAMARGPEALRDLPTRAAAAAPRGTPESPGRGGQPGRGGPAPSERPETGRPDGAGPPSQRPPAGGGRPAGR